MGFFQDTTNKEVNNSLWVEKYRPQKLEEYVGNKHLKQKVSDYLQSGDIPHLLFFGKAGTGKTTLAQLLAKEKERPFYQLSAINAGVKEVREIIQKAENHCSRYRRWNFIAGSAGNFFAIYET